MTKIFNVGLVSRMQMIKIGKGAMSKDFWQLGGGGGGGDRGRRGHQQHLRIGGRQHQGVDRKRLGCCARIRMYEENARFALLVLIMLIYLCCGAALFHLIEHDHEIVERRKYADRVATFKSKYCQSGPNQNRTGGSRSSSSSTAAKIGGSSTRIVGYTKSGGSSTGGRVDCHELDELLDLRGNLSAAGLTSPRLKWDWSGSFYFVGTVVSTIGYGMTTPRTTGGKVLVIIYGFFGCAGAILLFNLFLERVITLFAHVLRYVHDERERRAARRSRPAPPTKPTIRVRSDSDSESETSLEQWRPSVYVVMTCLFLLSSLLVLCAASVYQHVENWTYFESVYFCFVSFATIGFGDYVASQQQSNDTPGVYWYRAANFLFLTLGCCCIYSLFNVTSIVIRQFLNRLIRALDCGCHRPKCLRRRKQRPYLGLGLRPPKHHDHTLDSDSEGTPSRRTSTDGSGGGPGAGGGIMSLKEFLEQNKMNIYLMQKHIIESAQQRMQQNQYDTSSAISASAVGPLAILTKKFGED